MKNMWKKIWEKVTSLLEDKRINDNVIASVLYLNRDGESHIHLMTTYRGIPFVEKYLEINKNLGSDIRLVTLIFPDSDECLSEIKYEDFVLRNYTLSPIEAIVDITL
ncbi:hypothetical protein JHD46_05375 [Sulfurimonas sp. SAG-AH-194-C20]|nr:hypothetical protein [Sulfurimonas sp. SAG-AH-194-C20]MDF1879070.1 hypothetical protein [Sulfurimonas sp. SAG-AH-194-C20]